VAPEPARRRWDDLVEAYVRTTFRARPHLAVEAGYHEHDGRLADWSRSGLRSERRRLRGLAERAEDADPGELDGRRRRERDHLLALVDRDLFWLERARWPERNPLFYLETLSPRVYVTRPYAPPEERMKALARHAERIPDAASRIRDNLAPPLPGPSLEVAERAYDGLAAYFGGDALRAFEGVEDRGLQRELRAALETASEAIDGLTTWLGTLERAPVEASLLGRELLEEMLRATERIDVRLPRLDEVGRASLDRNTAGLERACRRLDPDGSVEDAVRRVRDDRPGDSLLAEARRVVPRLRRRVEEADLVTLPPGGETSVRPSPPFLRWNPAMIDIPGPGDDELPALFYIDPTGDGAGRSFSRPELLYVVAHETWPGHYLHFLHAHRSPSPLVRHFFGYALTEGWAHYAEELCWESGAAGDEPSSEVAMRLSALLRNVRLVVAAGLHGGELSFGEAERLFRERAHLDPSGARQQAARAVFDPQFLGYTLGKIVIRRLRGDWCGDRGGRAAWREFHDRLLGLGAPPLGLARQALLGDGEGGCL
jgi:hypothetical protein